MTNVFRVPEDFHCPNCEQLLEKYGSVHDMRCDNCGDIYSVEYLIEQAMLEAGILPERDWDDDL